jgi:molecular chaperone DnaK
VTIRVAQGERAMFNDNKLLGQFDLVDIPPAPRGVPQIEVTFDIDANGILNVSAKDLGTGKQHSIKITASSGLSKDEIERRRKEAESYAEDDKRKREEVETRNEADNAVYRTEKMLRENAEKVPAADKAKIEEAVKTVKESLKGNDTAEIRKGLDKLMEISQAVWAEVYKAAGEERAKAQAGATNSASGEAGGTSATDAPPRADKKDQGPIIDAEIVDEKKN